MLEGLNHIVLFVKDVEAAKVWYEKVGFTYKHGYDGMHWFALGEVEVMLHPAGEGRTSAPGPGLHAKVSDVDALFRHVVAQGLQPVDHQQGGAAIDGPVTRPWGHREFELPDPDGHNWAFTQV